MSGDDCGMGPLWLPITHSEPVPRWKQNGESETFPSLGSHRRRLRSLVVLQPGDPDARVDVVEVDQPVVRLRAPGERLVWPVPIRIPRPEPRDLAALPIEIAAQLPRGVEHARAGAVITHVEDVVLDPHVV